LGAILALGFLTALPVRHARTATPCCSVVSVDKTGIVTLPDNRTGQLEKIKVDSPQLAALKPGQQVDRSIGVPVSGPR
jgi:hypothetical protein